MVELVFTNFKPKIDLQSSDNSLHESVFVEIMLPRGKNIIGGCLYRPPDASLNLTGLLKISCQPSVLRISYLIIWLILIFFANVGPCLENKISLTQITYREFLIGNYVKCFHLNPTSPTKVSNVVYPLKNCKCEGFDSLCISL